MNRELPYEVSGNLNHVDAIACLGVEHVWDKSSPLVGPSAGDTTWAGVSQR